MLQVTNPDAIEFAAVAIGSSVIDILVLRNRHELVLTTSIQTKHMAAILGITGSRNLITWGVSSIYIHFRLHKRSPKPYIITRRLHNSPNHRLLERVEEVYNGKFLIMYFKSGCIRVFRLPLLSDNLAENIDVSEPEPIVTIPSLVLNHPIMRTNIQKRITQEDHDLRALLVKKIKALEQDVHALIDYDISVTGKTEGIYRKFCLNYPWLDLLNEQARKLCSSERESLLKSIEDKARVRSWILQLVTGETQNISVKVRAIFAGTSFENYSIRKPLKSLTELFDLHRFNEMSLTEDDDSQDLDEDEGKEAGADGENKTKSMKLRKVYLVPPGTRIYDHIMAEDFQMQDMDIVTGNQVLNEYIKFKVLLDGPLRIEFNKRFDEVQQYKQEIMNNITGTNNALTKIYNDMNCMLSLLHMETFTPNVLSVPQLMNDEVLERIMTVDDSEIKAINRRKKKDVVSDKKRGRLLLWSRDFWVRALNTMMDGVLEKLWEEEIKKTPPEPEFMSKRQPHDYTLEDQKLLRLYEETLRLLEEDRRKYLRILNVKEQKTVDLKKNFILKFNENCAQMAVLKLKYDYALRHLRVRILGMKVTFYVRTSRRKRIANLRNEMEKANDYIGRYGKLIDFWERSIADVKQDLESLTLRDKILDRHFKGGFLSSAPTHLSHELLKMYRRRPKMLQKSFQSPLVCHEVAARIIHKGRAVFPLPVEVMEYFAGLQALDDPSNAPNQLEPKLWDTFVKQRRQKIESELKIKGMGFQLADSQERLINFTSELTSLSNTKQQVNDKFNKESAEYIRVVQNHRLEITLPMGHVEVSIAGSMRNLRSCILMNIEDINEVNALIKKAGAKKLRTMQKLAVFRRQVLYKEWEHRMYRANIDYLKYMLEVIEKCKVSQEFLTLLRNWKKVKMDRPKLLAVGAIEKTIEEKIAAFRKNLDRILEKIANVKEQIAEMKVRNQRINHHIDEIKVDVTLLTTHRDTLLEEKQLRDTAERMQKIKHHSFLINEVRKDYAHILELKTILELQRLRTFPTLGPLPDDCPEVPITTTTQMQSQLENEKLNSSKNND